MSEKKKSTPYTVEFRESAVKLAVESDHPISKTADDLGVNKNTLHTWISKYHRPQKNNQLRLKMSISIPPLGVHEHAHIPVSTDC